jgi:hypothetical protein
VTDDDLVPVSVRLGEVVPPEDPEDWTRPLTWVAALGMLAGPLVALVWFAVSAPTQSIQALPATYLLAAALAAGAAATGATQQGVARAATATLGAGLFAGLVVVILGVAMAGERQVGSASPTLAHAFGAGLAGVAGAAAASVVAGMVARIHPGGMRFILALLAGVVVVLVVLGTLMPEVTKGS